MKRALIIAVQVAGLYGLYGIGVWLQHWFHLPIPGSIIGMLLLFFLLMSGVVKESWLGDGAQFLLSYLPLLFVPSTVGIADYLSLFQGRGLLSIAVVMISTVMVMTASGAIGQWRAKKAEKETEIHQETKGMNG
ncbi:CidA/LrgA family protein [Anoxybacillus rupiensis]|uniref:CidA/LrgA family protein n=1 Tax=Anoxybacteroides rupiense TaxID=311460 RepID=A0ABD5ISE1_9BACL|nr:CidA/LrgA family protein [Anoxybacillus rupiensis]MBS2771466.1 CidA/LrgA family protein [Anoxybacillus rupiensis]MDE8564691.1 CidA/LrgA family protein [Anoxybacillus rupiensis]MED5051207.1 CidA/LrgA family protein [Anoxybacillus rupiensis]